MTPELFNRLLHKAEGDSLDFKESQYPPLSNANEDAKRELLKDILAFANSWRESDGYILRGVREVQGGKSEVVGVPHHFDDAGLQQFVNDKTNRPVNFSYEAYSHDGKQVGIFTFRDQVRPVYLRNDSCGLRKHTTYVRRGSSTAEATPEEANEMAQASVATVPVLEAGFFDPATDESFGDAIEGYPTRRAMIDEEKLKPPPSDPRFGGIAEAMRQIRGGVSKTSLQKGIVLNSLLLDVQLCVTNHSATMASDVHFVAKFKVQDRLLVFEDDESSDMGFGRRIKTFNPWATTVEKVGDEWVLKGKFGKVQPGAISSAGKFHIGSAVEQDVELNVRIFSDEMPPISTTLELKLVPREGKPIDMDDLENGA